MIQLINLSKSFKQKEVISNVNFSFESGKKYAITGINGSGKSVLLKLICGYSLPDHGSIMINQVLLGEKTDFIVDAGISINAPEFLFDLTGLENLEILAEIQKKINKSGILKWTKLLEMDDFINKKYKTYSLGMKQKMRLVQALMEEPSILILDEPFNALDAYSVKLVKNILNNYMDGHKIIIFTSHHKEDIQDLSDVILELCDQQLLILD